MARWKLTEPHYLKVDGTKWEYSEVDRITGRPKRTQFDVPLYVNPNFEDDVRSFGQDDMIVVSDGNNSKPKDLIFLGPPTPSMLPLDDEAKTISGRFASVWKTPTEDGPTFSQTLHDDLIRQLAEASVSVKAAPAAEGMTEFMTTMAAMMKQQTEILAQLAKTPERRKVA